VLVHDGGDRRHLLKRLEPRLAFGRVPRTNPRKLSPTRCRSRGSRRRNGVS
jgi:hypothetical protein